MLVLTRKARETIVIRVPPSDQLQTIEVLVSSVRASKVSLSFNGSKDISILRGEVAGRNEKET